MKEGFTHFLPLPLRLCGFALLREILRPEGTGKASGTRLLARNPTARSTGKASGTRRLSVSRPVPTGPPPRIAATDIAAQQGGGHGDDQANKAVPEGHGFREEHHHIKPEQSETIPRAKGMPQGKDPSHPGRHVAAQRGGQRRRCSATCIGSEAASIA